MTRISTVTLSKSEQTADGNWVKCEVTATGFEDYAKAVKDLVGEINYALVELDSAEAPKTPEADEAIKEMEEKPAEEKPKKRASRKKASTEKKPKSTTAKEVPYDRTDEKLKQKFAAALTDVLPSWKTDCKPKAGELSQALNGLAMLDSDGNLLPDFKKALEVGLSDYLPNTGSSEEEDGL